MSFYIKHISSLQSNALVVGDSNPENKHKGINSKSYKKIKLSTNVLHDRFHRSDGALATIKVHDLWKDVYITPRNDSICTSCKIMTLPAASRGKTRNSQPVSPLDDIQVDTVPNPEPIMKYICTEFDLFVGFIVYPFVFILWI